MTDKNTYTYVIYGLSVINPHSETTAGAHIMEKDSAIISSIHSVSMCTVEKNQNTSAEVQANPHALIRL